MAIKIRKNGVVQDLIINANEVRVLDTDGNFRSKNLESVLKELNSTGGGSGGGMLKEAEYVFVSDTEPDYEGVWLDTSDGATESGMAESTLIEYIKGYIDNDVKAIVTKNEQIVTQLSNPNLLINPDFRIWQRGERFEINTPSREYNSDRWRCFNQANTTTIIEKTNNGLKHSSQGEGVSSLEHSFEIPNSIKGKKVTLSYEIKANKEISCDFYALKNSDVTLVIANKKFTCKSEYSIVTHTFYAPTDVDIMTLWIDRTDASGRQGGVVIDVKWVKLELGSEATPFVPRGYGEELALCQRYYQTVHFRGVAYGNGSPTNNININSNFPTPMRSVPTIKIVDNSVFDINEFKGVTFTYSSGNIYNNSITNILSSDNNVIGGHSYAFQIKLDAEIY